MKYLKAVLQESGFAIPRIHNLAELLALISKIDPSILLMQMETNIIEGYAVQFRYPGLSATKEDAKAALVAADKVCSYIKSYLRT